MNNLLVDEYNLRWNYILIEGEYRYWLKEVSYNSTKIDIMLLEYVKDCFRESYGANITIDWTTTLN